MRWVLYCYNLTTQTEFPLATFETYEEALRYLEEDIVVASRFDYYIAPENNGKED